MSVLSCGGGLVEFVLCQFIRFSTGRMLVFRVCLGGWGGVSSGTIRSQIRPLYQVSPGTRDGRCYLVKPRVFNA